MTGATEQTNGTNEQAIETPIEDKKTGSSFYKEKLVSMQQELEKRDNLLKQLQQKVEETEYTKLEETKNYKQLADTYKVKLNEAEKKAEDLAKSYFNDKKITAIKQKAVQEGIDQTCLKWLEKSEHNGVQIETTSTGNVNILGVDEFIQSFKQENPTFFPSKTPPTINNNAPGNKISTLSFAEILKLEKTDPVAYKAEIAKLQLKK
jgi:hypothetical protein